MAIEALEIARYGDVITRRCIGGHPVYRPSGLRRRRRAWATVRRPGATPVVESGDDSMRIAPRDI